MKIKIKTRDYRESVEFPVANIKYSLDEKNIPIDITIMGTEEVLEQIAEFSYYGWNIQDIHEDWTIHPQDIPDGVTHEALYARLMEFEVCM